MYRAKNAQMRPRIVKMTVGITLHRHLRLPQHVMAADTRCAAATSVLVCLEECSYVRHLPGCAAPKSCTVKGVSSSLSAMQLVILTADGFQSGEPQSGCP